jgi:hypothetical protein
MAEMIAILENRSIEDWRDMVGGNWYVCKAGGQQSFPVSVAKHFIGDWDIPPDDVDARLKERDRVLRRRPEGEEPQMVLISVENPPDGSKTPDYVEDFDTTILPQDVEPEFPELEKKKKAKKK